MAFQLPPLPNFNVQIPDLQQKALEGAQLRNMMSEMSLRQALAPGQVQAQQQQLEQQRIATQLQTMQLQGQQALTDWLKNGDAAEDVPAGNFSSNNKIATFVGVSPDDPIMNVVRSMAKHNVPAPMLVTEAQGMLQRRNEYFKGTKEEQDAQKNERTIWEDRLNFLHGLPEDQRSAQLAATWPLLRENSKTDPLLRAYAANLQGHPEAIDQAYNAIVGENSVLGFRKAKAEATEAEQKVIGPSGVSPQQTAELAKEQAEQPMKLQLATAEARAREQVQASMLPLMEDIRQQYANQKDARDKIESTVLKPYQDKMTDITTARAAIAQAQDNPVAARAAVFKMIGVAQPSGSHRVLPAEISAFRYPGGITDRVKERFNDFLKGEPWTPEVAAAAESFIQGQEGAARSTLNAGIGRNNQLYNTNVGQGLLQQGNAKADAAKLHTNMEDFSHVYTGAKGTIYSDDGKTWYDANGKLVK